MPPTRPLRAHERRLVDTLRQHGPRTRAELGTAAGVSRATVSAGLTALFEAGLVVDARDAVPPGPAGGRPPRRVRLSPRAGLALGVDVGRTHLRVALGDLGHQVLDERMVRLPADTPASLVLDRAAELARAAVRDAGFAPSDLVGVGVGLPAPVDRSTGLVAESTILPEWNQVAAAEEMSARTGCPTIVENDANLGALAEHLWGAARDCEAVAYVKLATGIGAGLVLGGRLFTGVRGLAGELGHVTLDEHGDLCRCGNRGCLELVAGGRALVAALSATHHGPMHSVEDVVELALQGDPAALRLVADAGGHLGVAAAAIVNLLNPDRLVVGGVLGRAGEVLLDPLRLALRRSALGPSAGSVEVVPSALGDRSEVLGAFAVVLREPERARAAEALSHAAVD